MSIMSFIQNKKKEFMEVRENRRNLNYEKKQAALIELQEKRKKAEKRAKIDESLELEKAKLSQLRKEQFSRSTVGRGFNLGGRVISNLQKRNRNNPNNPWQNTSSINPFGPEKTVKIKPRKKKVIIYE